MVPCRSRFLGVLLLGALAPAQQDPEQRPPATEPTAKQEYEALTKEYGLAQRELVAKWREEYKKWEAEVEKAKAAGEDAKAAGEEPSLSTKMKALGAEWTPKFQAGADKHKGKDGAIPFLLWITGSGPDADQEVAMATLMADHMTSPEFAQATAMIGRQSRKLGEARVRELLDQILAKNADGDVQAQAYLARANLAIESVKKKKQPEGADNLPVDPKTAQEAAIADLNKGIAKAKDAKLKGRLEGSLYEQQHLQPGMKSPDIVGNDLEGSPFKLSDYKGKVVLLDFWGDW
jgi:hypothetical protein